VKIHVFDIDQLPRRVLDRTWPNLAAKSAKNDSKLPPQDDPKSIKNRCQKSIKILIDLRATSPRLLGSPRRNALASWGDYRGVKKLHFIDLHIYIAYSGYKIWRFGISIGPKEPGSSTPRLRPGGAGGGLTSPRGTTAARPPFFHSANWGKAFGIHRFRRL